MRSQKDRKEMCDKRETIENKSDQINLAEMWVRVRNFWKREEN